METKGKTLQLRQRFVIYLLIVGLLSLISAGLFFYQGRQQLAEEVVDRRAEQLRQILEEKLNLKRQVALTNAIALSQDVAIRDALMNQDRDAAGVALQRIGEEYKRSSNFKGIKVHLHTAEGKSFYRSWAPNKFGDDITSFRPSVAQVVREQKAQVVLEVGRVGVSIRGIVPVFCEGSYCGSLELIQGVGSVSREFESQDRRYIMLGDEAMLKIADKMAGNERIGQYTVVSKKWFSEPTLAFARSAGIDELGSRNVRLGDDFLYATMPVVDSNGDTVGVHLIGEKAQVAVQEIDKAQQVAVYFFVLLVVLLSAVISIVYFSLNRFVVKPLQAINSELANNDGNLTMRLPVVRDDEIGVLSSYFNRFIGNLQEVIQEVSQTVSALDTGSRELLSVAEETRTETHHQQSQTSQVATAMSEMAANAQEVAHSAATAAQGSETANEATVNGDRTVHKTTAAIQDLVRVVEQAAETISKLQQDSNSIGAVIEIVQQISEQTNLLALNAAIEAARAGENGRGFAVVADEVRALARRTHESTDEIKTSIERIQTRAKEAAEAMDAGTEFARTGVEHSGNAAAALSAIREASMSIQNMTAQIAGAADQQRSVADEMDRSISSISEISEQNASRADRVQSEAANFSQLTGGLERLVGRFRV